jgi:hypothetical protein
MTSVKPIDTITFSTTVVNGLGVTITDITLAYLNVAAAHALRADGTTGVVSVARLTEMALLVAESEVKRFVRNVLAGTTHNFADMTGAEIGEVLFMNRNGWASCSVVNGPERSDALNGTAWNMGMVKLCDQADGSVDWF